VSSLTSPALANPAEPPHLCQNCSAPLTGPFCAACGQHDVDYHRGFHHLFHDLMENLFHFEGKFFVTVAWLLAKPGRITLEFLAGRRASQLNPLRFYIFVSVMFFLGVSLLNHGHLIDLNRKKVEDIQLDLTKQAKKVKENLADLTPEEKVELEKQMSAAAKRAHGVFDGDAVLAAVKAARKARAAQPNGFPRLMQVDPQNLPQATVQSPSGFPRPNDHQQMAIWLSMPGPFSPRPGLAEESST